MLQSCEEHEQMKIFEKSSPRGFSSYDVSTSKPTNTRILKFRFDGTCFEHSYNSLFATPALKNFFWKEITTIFFFRTESRHVVTMCLRTTDTHDSWFSSFTFK